MNWVALARTPLGQKTIRVVLILAVVTVAFTVGGIVMVAGIAGGTAAPAAAAITSQCATALTPGAPEPLNPEQSGNAATIVAVGRSLNVPQLGLEAALITAITESNLRNLPYGDRDSLGLFQQRPSQGWGTPTQILDPTYAASKFYTALLAVPAWTSMTAGVAAQTVQRSAYPDRYQTHLPTADAYLGATTVTCTPTTVAAVTTPGPGGLTLTGSPAGNAAVTFAYAQLGKPYVFGSNGPNSWDCSSLTQAAWAAGGVNIPRVTYTQAVAGTAVPLTQARSGDIVLSAGSDGTSTNPGHVGMIAGTDASGVVWLIEAAHTGVPVRLSPQPDWVNLVVTIRRIG